MRLSSLQYSENDGTTEEWSLDPLRLGQINLLVGKNAIGKTRVLNVIGALSKLLCGKIQDQLPNGHWKAILESSAHAPDQKVTYDLHINHRQIVEERYSVGRKVLMHRTAEGSGKISAAQLKNTKLGFLVSPTQLIALSKRDALQHPYLDELCDWGASVRHYRFGSDLGKNMFPVFVNSPEVVRKADLDLEDNTAVVFKVALDRFRDDFTKRLLDDLLKIGYDCSEVGLQPLEGFAITNGSIPSIPSVLYVQERDLEVRTTQTQMSQGMFRALSTLVMVNAGTLVGSPQLVLVDDIGEGLDFDRASRLIKLLVEKASNHSFQLVMTTNDRFIMNAVPLEYWSVLHREGSHVSVFNSENSKKAFSEFRYLGLNNFDFFSGRHFLTNASNSQKPH